MIKPMNRKSKAHPPLKRLLSILTYLVDHRFGGSLEDLAEEAEISTRQVHRYITVLNDCGVEIKNDYRQGIESRYRLINPTRSVLKFKNLG